MNVQIEESWKARLEPEFEKDGKSSVSCPLKPSDSTPLKHSTMPP